MSTVGEQVDAIAEDMVRMRAEADGHDATAVPLFGVRQGRIPEQMKEDAPVDWTKLPEAQIEILPDYGPEHDRLVHLRSELEQMKRTINSLGPLCESQVRYATALQQQDLSEEKRAQTMARDAEAQQKRDAAFESLRLVVEKIEDSDASTIETVKSRLEAMVADIVQRGSTDFRTKEIYAEYWGFLRSQTQKIFAEQKKLLERIKVIKREAQAGQTGGPQPSAPAAPAEEQLAGA